ncbi:MAG TPA: hypothetical protein VHX15_15740 [Frankiaceae bacterium]|jgi:hypothetical protein|nr:hypothetical protein [Frankiaceae bacterium]
MTTPPDPATADPATDPPEPDPAADPAAQPDTTDWKAQARKWEARAAENKAAAKKLAEIEAANQSAQERAETAAKAAEDRAQAATLRIASAEVRAALTGIVPDPAAIVEDLNLAKYLTEDGEVDADKVAALQAKYQALAPAGSRAPRPNPAQGGSGQPAKTLTELVADLERKPGKTAAEMRELMRMKARQMTGKQG